MEMVSVTFAMPVECEPVVTATLRAPTEAGRTPPPVYVKRAISRRAPPSAAALPSPFAVSIWLRKVGWHLGPNLSPAIARVLQAIVPPEQAKPPARVAAVEQSRPAKHESARPASEAAIRAAIRGLDNVPKEAGWDVVKDTLRDKTVPRSLYRKAWDAENGKTRPGPRPKPKA
jgi:hypothetical protein